jgi:hypothetical protein
MYIAWQIQDVHLFYLLVPETPRRTEKTV